MFVENTASQNRKQKCVYLYSTYEMEENLSFSLSVGVPSPYQIFQHEIKLFKTLYFRQSEKI